MGDRIEITAPENAADEMRSEIRRLPEASL
jgi:hypothetical protein